MRISDWSSDVCSSDRASAETDRRREKQVAYNEANVITPTTIKRNIADVVAHVASGDYVTPEIDEETSNLVGHNLRAYIEDLEKRMRKAAGDLERKSTRLNSSHYCASRMPSSA